MRPRFNTAALSILVLCFACSAGGEAVTKIEESPVASVFLRRIADPSFQAAHPIKIDSRTIALLLNGILIHDHPPQPGNTETADAVKRDAEIEALRKELQEIKKQLAEQQAERARSQPPKTMPSN